MALELNNQNFSQEVKNFDGVALVDFWAPWCTPCKMQGPIVEQLAQEMTANPKIKISKLNVDDNMEISQEYGIMSIPTLKIFKNGQVVEDMTGLQSKESLIELINKHLA